MIHVFGVVIWVGALLVLSSLMSFAAEMESEARPALTAAARRLVGRSANIGGLLAIGFGIVALAFEPRLLMVGWFHVKLLCVLILIGCHLWLYQRIAAARRAPGSIGRGEFLWMHAVVSAALLVALAMVLARPF